MKDLLHNTAETVRNLFHSDSGKLSDTLNQLESKITKQTIGKDIKPQKPEQKDSEIISEQPKKLYFSTCYREKEQLDKSKVEHIISQLNLYAQDRHISSLEIEKLRAHANMLDDDGIYLVVDECSGVIAIPNHYYASGIEFEQGIVI